MKHYAPISSLPKTQDSPRLSLPEESLTAGPQKSRVDVGHRLPPLTAEQREAAIERARKNRDHFLDACTKLRDEANRMEHAARRAQAQMQALINGRTK